MILLQQLLFILLGLVFGSFYAAFSWRYPRGISNAKGRSFCDSCKKQIFWYDNIPLLSYLFLGGKCRNCKKHISFRYPLIEAFTALGFLCLFNLFNMNIFLLLYSLSVFSILILIFIIDFEHKIIPDYFVFLGVLLIFLFLFLTDSRILYPNIFAGFGSAFLLLLIHIFTRGRGMGLGDVKFAVFGGLLIGLKLSLIWLFLSFLTGGIAGIILILGGRARLKDQIAFGPFLVIGLLFTLLFGHELLIFLGL
ncbi:MAG: prepilin peptidase [Candidatus Woesebacteria bacterium]|nr:MAG: prepilin peptidase [Candidatus Woesebacteria bacterium]